MNNKETLSKKLRADRVPLISIFIIDCIYFKRIQKCLLFNLKITVERSKRRYFLTLTFLVRPVVV